MDQQQLENLSFADSDKRISLALKMSQYLQKNQDNNTLKKARIITGSSEVFLRQDNCYSYTTSKYCNEEDLCNYDILRLVICSLIPVMIPKLASPLPEIKKLLNEIFTQHWEEQKIYFKNENFNCASLSEELIKEKIFVVFMIIRNRIVKEGVDLDKVLLTKEIARIDTETGFETDETWTLHTYLEFQDGKKIAFEFLPTPNYILQTLTIQRIEDILKSSEDIDHVIIISPSGILKERYYFTMTKEKLLYVTDVILELSTNFSLLGQINYKLSTWNLQSNCMKFIKDSASGEGPWQFMTKLKRKITARRIFEDDESLDYLQTRYDLSDSRLIAMRGSETNQINFSANLLFSSELATSILTNKTPETLTNNLTDTTNQIELEKNPDAKNSNDTKMIEEPVQNSNENEYNYTDDDDSRSVTSNTNSQRSHGSLPSDMGVESTDFLIAKMRKLDIEKKKQSLRMKSENLKPVGDSNTTTELPYLKQSPRSGQMETENTLHPFPLHQRQSSLSKTLGNSPRQNKLNNSIDLTDTAEKRSITPTNSQTLARLAKIRESPNMKGKSKLPPSSNKLVPIAMKPVLDMDLINNESNVNDSAEISTDNLSAVDIDK